MREIPAVVESLSREHEDAVRLWASLPADAWIRPSLCRGWTVKDVVVHCVKGESEIFQPFLRRALDGDPAPPPGFELAAANDRQILENRARKPGDLIEEARETFAVTGAMLAGLSEQDWSKPSWNPIMPDTVGFYVKGRIWEWWTHNQDVRVPLRIPGGREPERTRPVVEVVRDGIAGVFLPERAKGVHVSYAFQVGDTPFTIRIDDGTLRVDHTFDAKATARVVADPATFVLVGTRRVSQAKAVLSRKFRPSGNPVAGLRFLSYFAAP